VQIPSITKRFVKPPKTPPRRVLECGRALLVLVM
jgi:hypothetical protein